MTIGYPSAPNVARLTPQDRASAVITTFYSASGIAPHSLTTRITYTVPTLTLARVDTMMIDLQRDAAAAPAGACLEYVALTPSGGSLLVLMISRSTVAAVMAANQTQFAAMIEGFRAGDVLNVKTTDSSTGGSYAFTASVVLTEYSV